MGAPFEGPGGIQVVGDRFMYAVSDERRQLGCSVILGLALPMCSFRWKC